MFTSEMSYISAVKNISLSVISELDLKIDTDVLLQFTLSVQAIPVVLASTCMNAI